MAIAGRKPTPINITADEVQRLEEIVAHPDAWPDITILRCNAVLCVVHGMRIKTACSRLGCSRRTIQRARYRWDEGRVLGMIVKKHHTGRPRKSPIVSPYRV